MSQALILWRPKNVSLKRKMMVAMALMMMMVMRLYYHT